MSTDGNTYTDLEAQPTIVGGVFVAPPPPPYIAVMQSGAYVLAKVVPPSASGTNPSAALRLYRGPTSDGPWDAITTQPLSELSLPNHLFDLSPVPGVQTYYYATTVDIGDQESAQSDIVSISIVPPTS